MARGVHARRSWRVRALVAVPGRCLAEALREALEDAGAEVVGVAVTAQSTLELCRATRPGVLVLDPAVADAPVQDRVPHQPGPHEAGAHQPPPHPAHPAPEHPTALDLTALHEAARELVPGLHVVRLDPGPDGPSLAEVVEAVRLGGSGAGVEVPSADRDAIRLTDRELLVLEKLCLGLDVVRIARELGITTNTCRGYVRAILTKLDVQSQVQAVVTALTLGIVALPAPRPREGSVA